MQAVFGHKQQIRTFGNKPLEVYAAELSGLVRQPFQGYGLTAIKREILRRFIAGHNSVLQGKQRMLLK